MTEIKFWIARQHYSHSDLACPIQFLAKDGYKYVIDYSGLIMLDFLKNKSLAGLFFSMVRLLLMESKLPQNLMASAYVRNRCYNRNTEKTRHESFPGSKPILNKIHIFGTTSFYYVQNKTKLDPRYEKGIFVGYDK